MKNKIIRQNISDTCNVDQFFGFKNEINYALPIIQTHAQARFSSPTDNYIKCKLNLNKRVIKHPTTTFFVRATSNSMIGANINPDNTLIADRTMQVTETNAVIAYINGEFTAKHIAQKKNKLYLVSENDNFDSIEITTEMDFEIWDIVFIYYTSNNLTKEGFK